MSRCRTWRYCKVTKDNLDLGELLVDCFPCGAVSIMLWAVIVFALLLARTMNVPDNPSDQSLALIIAGLSILTVFIIEASCFYSHRFFLGVNIMWKKLSKILAFWTFLAGAVLGIGVAINWNLFVVGFWLAVAFLGFFSLALVGPVFVGGTVVVFKILIGSFKTLDGFYDRAIKAIASEMTGKKEDKE